MVQPSEIAVMDARPDGGLHDGDVQIVPAAVDDTVPAFQLPDEARRIAGVERHADGPIVPLRRRETFGPGLASPRDPDDFDVRAGEEIRDGRLGHRAISTQDEDLQSASP